MELNKVISKEALLQLPAPGVEEKHLLDTDYADDMAMLDNSKEGLQETTDLLYKYSAYAGLKINAGKTQSMAVSKSARRHCGHQCGRSPNTAGQQLHLLGCYHQCEWNN